MPPSTMQDLLNQVVTDTTQITTDQAAVAADQAKLSADQATEVTDTATLATDTSTFASALAKTGPFFTLSADGSTVTVYSPSSSPPGYETANYPSGSKVPIPTVPPPDNPVASS